MTEPTVTEADRELFVKLVGYDSETIDAILAGRAFTWEVEQVARHREAERKAVLAWLRRQINGYPLNARYAEAIATGKHLEETHDPQ